MFNIRWKFKEHKDLLRMGVRHSLFLDMISKKYRKQSFAQWDQYPRRIARECNCIFSDNTPSGPIRDIFVERMYDVKGFVPRKGGVVIDAGANVGDSAIWWARQFDASVHAFEPLPEVYSILLGNIQLNDLSWRISPYNIALGNGGNIQGSLSSEMLTSNQFSDTSGATYQTRRIDDMPWKEVDLLKIDVEGFEVEVLKGAEHTIRTLGPKIIMEVHSRALKKRCIDMLQDMGYKLIIEGRVERSRNKHMDLIQNIFFKLDKD